VREYQITLTSARGCPRVAGQNDSVTIVRFGEDSSNRPRPDCDHATEISAPSRCEEQRPRPEVPRAVHKYDPAANRAVRACDRVCAPDGPPPPPARALSRIRDRRRGRLRPNSRRSARATPILSSNSKRVNYGTSDEGTSSRRIGGQAKLRRLDRNSPTGQRRRITQGFELRPPATEQLQAATAFPPGF
jgi:hypothetical protein